MLLKPLKRTLSIFYLLLFMNFHCWKGYCPSKSAFPYRGSFGERSADCLDPAKDVDFVTMKEHLAMFMIKVMPTLGGLRLPLGIPRFFRSF